jgi:hypothetical protein
MLVEFLKNLSYSTKCMYPHQVNHHFSRDIRTTPSRVYVKVSTKYLEMYSKIHLKQLHAKMITLAWDDGLDAFRY